MHFLLLAHDGTDAEAPSRRAGARPAHLAGVDRLRASGNIAYAAALLDDSEQMIGSMMVMNLPSRADLDAWLATEPYVVQKVWESIDVSLCRPGPAFAPA